MYLDDRAVQRHRLQLDLNDLLLLQPRKHPIQHARLAPAIHARIDRVPVPKATGQSAPFAPLFGDMQDGIDYLEVAQAHIASLARQAVCNPAVLGFGDLHLVTLPGNREEVN